MIRAACRSVIFAFGQATRRTQEHPGSANNKPQVVEAAAEVVEAAEAAAAAVSRGEVAASVSAARFCWQTPASLRRGFFFAVEPE
jgi:fatty acid/phospholipid biosynthesis enzyme